MAFPGANNSTLVLGGGGLSGIAWMTGLILGFKDAGVDVCTAKRIIGTSAGSTVGAQIWSGVGIEELFARQIDSAKQVRELSPSIQQLRALFGAFQSMSGIADPRERRRWVGNLALASETVSEAERRAVIAARLPSHRWPDQRLCVTALDAETGDLRVFEANSGVDLIDAVAASCAVPVIWPPVTIEGRRYIDGGLRSGNNADLAEGADQVLILSPIAVESVAAGEVAFLKEKGADVTIIEPDAAARSVIGINALDPSIRPAAAQAGREQGRRDAEKISR